MRIRLTRLALFIVFSKSKLKTILADYNYNGERTSLKAWVKEADILLNMLESCNANYLVGEKEECDLCYSGNCLHACHSNHKIKKIKKRKNKMTLEEKVANLI